METSAGLISVEQYDEECSRGIKVLLNGVVVAMLDVYEPLEGEIEGEARVLVYKKEYSENEECTPIECITINR